MGFFRSGICVSDDDPYTLSVDLNQLQHKIYISCPGISRVGSVAVDSINENGHTV